MSNIKRVNSDRYNAAHGFSMMEVLVALALMSVVASFLTPAFIAQSKYNTNSEVKSLAIEATDRQIDTMRLTDPATMPNSGSSTAAIVVGGKTFSIKIDYCVVTAYCSVVTRHLKFTTIYRNQTVYATETVFTQLR